MMVALASTTIEKENTPLTREEILALPGPERRIWVEQIKVFYPRWRRILEDIADIHRLNTMAAEPQGLLLVGQTGAGKTTLIETYARQYPVEYTEFGIRRRVVQVTNPSPATIGNLATALLYALGDPNAGRGVIGNRTQRIINYFRDCQVELLILDELQHFVDRESQKVLLNASNWLKTLIKETKVACVFVGLQGEAEQIVSVNPQLARLFGDPRILTPFEWDEDYPTITIDEFRKLLGEIEKSLPLRESTSLSSRDTAKRCFVASGGSISYLMALLRSATHKALMSGREKLDHTLLSQAFEQRLAGERRGIQNPFGEDVNVAALSTLTPALSVRSAVGAIGSTNRRSRRRKERVETLSDLRG